MLNDEDSDEAPPKKKKEMSLKRANGANKHSEAQVIYFFVCLATQFLQKNYYF